MSISASTFGIAGTLPFNTPKTGSIKRIGPHNEDLFSILFGSLLGDSCAERHGEGTRICFQQEGSHSAYLFWLHQLVAQLGYCNITKPKLTTRLGAHGKLRQVLRFKTFTFTSFNWIEELFYIKDPASQSGSRLKILPASFCIEKFITPLALAIWIMDDGAKVSSGLKICTNNFSSDEVLVLCDILTNKFGIKATKISAPHPQAGAKKNVTLPAPTDLLNGSVGRELLTPSDQYHIYISKYSMEKLATIVKPFFHPSMKYKLNGFL